ncbi:MAG TPA: hypothetical protein VMZ91_11270 [Candidatus Paceibacterota bacterium]|nr:hypothetical protein [Candidatus Paceibacterota bacterium]
MKLDKAIDILQEEWADSIKMANETRDIFVNPTDKEIKEIMGGGIDFRFIADSETKKFYVFSGYLLHNKAAESLGLANFYTNEEQTRIIAGIAYKGDVNKYELDGSYNFYTLSSKARKEMTKKDWSWTNKWVNLNELFSNKKNIKEEWLDTVKMDSRLTKSRDIDIFVNPTPKELREVIGSNDYFRFIADNETKKIYVFEEGLLHETAAKSIGIIKDYYAKKPRLICGVARRDGSVQSSFNFISYSISERKKILKMGWSWTKKWVDIATFIEEKINYKTVKIKNEIR